MPKESTQTTHPRRTITKTTEATREQICKDHFLDQMSVKEICTKYDLADNTVRGILDRFRETDEIAYKPRGGARNVKIKEDHSNYLIHLINAEKHVLTLRQLRGKLMENFPSDFPSESSLSLTAINRHLKKQKQHIQK
ncbi:hypothetical protein BDB01DRAFT_797315 [Pilobolus umbonatus]|nr:hypothetical protein BDB01DRAFT_797315 [Pilobolus umbonatus]